VASITGQLGLIVTGDKAEAEAKKIAFIYQDAKMYAGRLARQSVHHELDPVRKGYLHVAKGEVTVGNVLLQTGDALLISSERELNFDVSEQAEVLFFDLPA
jgi:redox-sensitive bicupin YhaK (pirin superfamily)